MGTPSKTQWNLKRLAFALELENGGWGTPVDHPGVIQLTVSASDNSNNKQAADGGLFFDGSGKGNKTGELQVTKFNDWFRTNILGHISEGGGIGEGDGASQSFAMLFEAETDQGGIRGVWYFCTASDISNTFGTNDVDGNYTFAPETSTITAKMGVLPNGNKRRAWQCEEGTENYDDFFGNVYYPVTTTTTTTTTTTGGEG